jgi:uncharacterized protein YdaU (DUF1376 family)
MRKGKAPAYQRYPSDMISDPRIASFTAEEFGVYERMKDYIWLDEKLHWDPKSLARLLRVSPKKFIKIFDTIGTMFTFENGYLRSPELDRERLKQAERAEKSRLGGINSGISRRQGALNATSSSLKPNLNISSSASISTSSPSSERTTHTHLENEIAQVGNRSLESDSQDKSSFSFELREEYARSNGLGTGWIVNSSKGGFDKLIQKWVDKGKPTTPSMLDVYRKNAFTQ